MRQHDALLNVYAKRNVSSQFLTRLWDLLYDPVESDTLYLTYNTQICLCKEKNQ